MVTEKEIWEILEDFHSIKPVEFLQQIDITSMGISNLLCFLASSDRIVSAGEISEHMNVSTARVAVLLKKMSEKNLIEKSQDPSDARRVMVSITDEGRKLLQEKRQEILLYSGAIVERFGKDRIMEFIETCKEIKEIVREVEESQAFLTNSSGISNEKRKSKVKEN